MMSVLSPNIRFKYQYRDAANYKLFAEVIFSNPCSRDIEWMREQVQLRLIDGEFFEPKKWGLMKPQFPIFDQELDHDWCEFDSLSYTDEKSSMSIESFIQKMNESR